MGGTLQKPRRPRAAPGAPRPVGRKVLRGIRHQRTRDGAFARDLASYDEWRAVLESLSVSLRGVAGDELRALHGRMLAAHTERAAEE